MNSSPTTTGTAVKPTAEHYTEALDNVQAAASAYREIAKQDLDTDEAARMAVFNNPSHPDYPADENRLRILRRIEEQSKLVETLKLVRDVAQGLASREQVA